MRIIDLKKPLTGKVERYGEGYKVTWHNATTTFYTCAEFKRIGRRKTVIIQK